MDITSTEKDKARAYVRRSLTWQKPAAKLMFAARALGISFSPETRRRRAHWLLMPVIWLKVFFCECVSKVSAASHTYRTHAAWTNRDVVQT